MSNVILILGESGTGKSTGIRTLNPLETFIFNCGRKPLPFAGSKISYKTVTNTEGKNIGKESYAKSNIVNERNMDMIRRNIVALSERRADIKNIIVDDLAYALLESVFDRFDDKNFDKFKQFAKEVKELIDCTKLLRDDLTIFIMNHIEYDTDAGGNRRVIFKMPAGKFTKEAIVPEGLFDTVLYSECLKDGKNMVYYYRTHNNGNDTCKSPSGMFTPKIPNDLQYVKDCYIAYHNGEKMPEVKEVKVEGDF